MDKKSKIAKRGRARMPLFSARRTFSAAGLKNVWKKPIPIYPKNENSRMIAGLLNGSKLHGEKNHFCEEVR